MSKNKWVETPYGNKILQRDGYYISFQPNKVAEPLIRSFDSDSDIGETAVVVNESGTINPYWILKGDYRKQFEEAKSLKECYKILKENENELSDWSNDLESFPKLSNSTNKE